MKLAFIELGPSRPELHEPIGISVLLAAIKSSHPSVECTFLSQSLSPGCLENAEWQDFDAIFVGCKLGNFFRFQSLYSCIREKCKATPIVLGDLIPTFADGAVLERFSDVICVRGEADLVIVQLVTCLTQRLQLCRSSLRDVPNLSFLEDGELVRTKKAMVPSMSIREPTREMAKLCLKKGAQVQLEASRGCPWSKCSFCAIPALNGLTWRPVAEEQVTRDLCNLSAIGSRFPYFTDADFIGGDIERGIRIARRIQDLKRDRLIHPSMSFYFNIQATGVLGGAGVRESKCDEFLDEWKKAGLIEVFVGIESGDFEQVRRMGKASNENRNLTVIKKLESIGIDLDIGFIMFDPKMTIATLKNNLAFIEKANIERHPSRLTKALRIQPGTGYAESFFSGNLPSLNINNLSYPYDFDDDLVERIYRSYRVFEKKFLDYTTLVQGLAKSELPDLDTRRILRHHLSQLRYIDLGFLKDLVKQADFGRADMILSDDAIGLAQERMCDEIRSRPSEVDTYACRLGVKIGESSILFDEFYESQFRVLNVTDDPAGIAEVSRNLHSSRAVT